MRTFIIKPGDLIPIGRAGENQATQVRFDVTGWAETFGAGQFELIMQRPGDNELPYPVEVTVDGDYVVWTVSNVDTGIAGNCKVQLRYVVSDAVAKSVIYRGIVGESLDHAVDPPDPYDDLVERLEELARQTEQNAEAASRSAGNASDSADAAGRSANNAADSATEAGRSANNAAQSATDANAAKLAAQTAQQHAEAAQADAEAAEARIMDTVPDAVTDWLDEHITQETGYVIDDSLTVQGAAADAKAVGDALIDKAPIITDTSSGAIASFPDGADAPVKSVTVGIEPVQDLHGYDNPWPAGGGKNLYKTQDSGTLSGVTYTVAADGTVTLNGTCTQSNNIKVTGSLKAGTYKLCDFATGTFPSNSQARTAVYSASPAFDIFRTNTQAANVWSDPVTLSEDASSVEFRIRIENGFNYQNCKLKPMLADSAYDGGYAPYSNICPITGWTGANVGAAGNNLLDYSTQTDGYRLDGNGDLVASGNHAVSDYIRVAPEESYYFRNMIGSTSGYALAEYDAYKRLVRSQTFYGSGSQSKAVTMQASTKYIRVCYGKTHTDDPAVLSPVDNTDFAPYIGTTYPITFPSEAGTVYGGTVTVNQDGTGTIVVEKAGVTVANLLVSIPFKIGAASCLKRFTLPAIAVPCEYNKRHGAIASFGVEGSAYFGSDRSNNAGSTFVNFAITTGGEYLAIYDADRTLTDETFMAKYGSNTVVYPLATPVTYTLTAEQTAEITTLLGQNNVWANCGDIAGIQYRCDTKLYIDKKLAALVAALS